ncbi:MAG: D-glycero-beta-D-manno-heptose-7-phosphate kinase [Candidatus Zixiibacteriota bacterium]
MERVTQERFDKIFSGWGDHNILVLGDVMLDEYLWGNVSRISPEAPVPVVEINQESLKLGGAANVALNIRRLGDAPILVGVVGDDRNGARMMDILGEGQIGSEGIFVDHSRATTIKTRVIAHHQQVVRTDRENTEEISDKLAQGMIAFVKKKMPEIKGLIISDYGKGMITYRLLTELIELCRRNRVFISVDPKETHFMNYQDVSLITPNHHEAGFAYGKRIKDENVLEEVGWGLLEKLRVEALLITRGEEGMSLFEADKTLTHFPTKAKKVYDVTGAGDTVISAFTCAVAAGASYKEATLISNHAAGIVVGEIGTSQTTRQELMDDLRSFIDPGPEVY